MDENVSLQQHPNYPQIVASASWEAVQVWPEFGGRNV